MLSDPEKDPIKRGFLILSQTKLIFSKSILQQAAAELGKIHAEAERATQQAIEITDQRALEHEQAVAQLSALQQGVAQAGA